MRQKNAELWLQLLERYAKVKSQGNRLPPERNKQLGKETMRVTLESGQKIEPKHDAEVKCDLHGVTVRWGDLSAIQQLAVAEGLDVEGPCILLPNSRD